jgi:hypothetical protein
MACCGSKPRVTLLKNASYRPMIDWHDRCASGTPPRQLQWLFYRNGSFVYSTTYGQLTDSLPIGSGSTYSILNATEVEIVTFLVGQGITINTGDFIQIRVRIRNCDKEFAISNAIGFSAPVIIVPACTCDFVRAYDIRQTGTNPIPPVGFTPVGGQLFFVNGLLTDGNITDPLVNEDELMWLTLSGGCDDSFEIATVNNAIGNVTVPPGFLSAVPNSAGWLVARNGVIQSGFTYSIGQIIPDTPSAPDDVWLFVGLTGGDCTFITVPVNAFAVGATLNLPGGYSATNQARFLPIRDGVVMYNAANSEDGYTLSGSVLTAVTPFTNEEVWLLAIG